MGSGGFTLLGLVGAFGGASLKRISFTFEILELGLPSVDAGLRPPETASAITRSHLQAVENPLRS